MDDLVRYTDRKYCYYAKNNRKDILTQLIKQKIILLNYNE